MDKEIIGWQEYCSLPELNINKIRAKIDSGAKTSALHAFNIEVFDNHGEDYVRFMINPRKKMKDLVIHCEAKLIGYKIVSNSGGKKEKRCVISTNIDLKGRSWDIEITLTNRHSMQCPMLIGRDAISNKFVIDTHHKFLISKSKKDEAKIFQK